MENFDEQSAVLDEGLFSRILMISTKEKGAESAVLSKGFELRSQRGEARCRRHASSYLCHLHEHAGDAQVEENLQKALLHDTGAQRV